MRRNTDQASRLKDAARASGPEWRGSDRRRHTRHEYRALVGITILDGSGSRRPPAVLRARNLSTGGLGVMSRCPLEVGGRGAVQMVRADGRHALAGIEVRHCRYVQDQAHEVGLMFAALSPGMKREDYLGADGRMALFDPLLRENIGR